MIKAIYKNIFSEKARLNFHKNIRKMKSLFLKGSEFYCPCCEKYSRKFLKKGNGIKSRKNAICPNCGSLERTRLLYLFLRNETLIFNGNPSILHFAPEEALKKYLISNPNYYDVDLNPNLATYKMDITNIEFPDSKFEYIICSHVLGHIPDEKRAISELYRVLKRDGKLLFLSLMDMHSSETIEDPYLIKTAEQKLQRYGESDLERLYGSDFINRIQTEEITVERIDYRNEFNDVDRHKMSLGNGEREIIYLVTKK